MTKHKQASFQIYFVLIENWDERDEYAYLALVLFLLGESKQISMTFKQAGFR